METPTKTKKIIKRESGNSRPQSRRKTPLLSPVHEDIASPEEDVRPPSPKTESENDPQVKNGNIVSRYGVVTPGRHLRRKDRYLKRSYTQDSFFLLRPATKPIRVEPVKIKPVKTVSRAGRKTPSNLQNDFLGESSADESDDNRKDTSTDFFDYGVDISTDDKAWDTDLEPEDTKEAYDHTGKTAYIEACKRIGVIPVSYFLRNMQNPRLVMKHHGLGPLGVKPICISLVSNTHVIKLSLADNWLGPQGGQHVSEMLKENCFVQEMDLSDNRVGLPFAETLVDLLSVNITMTKLVLSGNELDDKAAIYLAEAIMVTNRLEDLVISHNKFGEKAGIVLGPAIAENMTIKNLDLSWNHIRRKGAVAIAQGIKHNMFLKSVNLSWNGFGLEGAIAIGDALKTNSVLDELDISNNRITAEGAVIIGKGLAVNENLKVLKMGKNPMQTAGCYGILAALLRNPNSVMKRLDFSDILVNKDFREIAQQVKEQLPDLNIHTGGDSLPTRPKARIHPMLKLRNYIAKHDLKLIDVFNKWDTDKSMSVTYEEFVAGVEELGLKLEEEEITTLIQELDKDGDGEINYSELVAGETDFTEKERKMKSIISGFKLAVIEAKS